MSTGRSKIKRIGGLLLVAVVSLMMLFGSGTTVSAAEFTQTDSMGLVVTGNAVKGRQGFNGNILYLTNDQMEKIKNSESTEGFGIGDCWMGDTVYSSHDPHGTAGHYHYERVKGIDVKALLTAAGVNTSKVKTLYCSTTDNYPSVLSANVFSGRYYYPPGSSSKSGSRYPVIAMYRSESSSETSAGAALPGEAEKLASGENVFVFGQKTALEDNNCLFAKHADALIVDPDSFTDRIDSGNISGILRINDLMHLGIFTASYTYTDGTDTVTDNVKGEPLSKVISALGMSSAEQSSDTAALAVTSSDGSVVETIPLDKVSGAFAAWDYTDGKTASSSQKTQFMVYTDGESAAESVMLNARTLSFVTFSGKIVGTSSNINSIGKTTLSTAKYKKTRSAVVKWKKTKNAAGYQIAYSASSKFKNKKTITVLSGRATSKTISKLAKKTYNFKIRAYKTVDGNKVYGKYSSVKKVKIK